MRRLDELHLPKLAAQKIGRAGTRRSRQQIRVNV
jgi:hypothetical protein